MSRVFSPAFSGLYPAYHRRVDAKSRRYICLAPVRIANFISHLTSDFWTLDPVMMVFPGWKISRPIFWMPALLGHVRHIVFLGAEKEMRRPHAQRIIAFVKDVHAVWHGLTGNKPRNPVREYLPRKMSGAEISIALLVERCSPIPAFRSLVHAGPEPFQHFVIGNLDRAAGHGSDFNPTGFQCL